MVKRLVLSLFLSICLSFIAFADSPKPNQAIPLGEDLVYRITWIGIPVGIGQLFVREKTTLNGREVYHVVGIVETNKVLSKIFPMHDEAHSFIDAETFESVQFEKVINELIINTHEKMVFDHDKGKGYFESFKTSEKKEFDIESPVHDAFSVFYWVRRQDFIPGKSVKTTLVADRKEWALEAKVVKKEKVKIDGKKIDTIRIEPNTIVEGKEKKGLARFNLTDDASRTPVRISYKATFGRVTGTLVKVDSEK